MKQLTSISFVAAIIVLHNIDRLFIDIESELEYFGTVQVFTYNLAMHLILMLYSLLLMWSVRRSVVGRIAAGVLVSYWVVEFLSLASYENDPPFWLEGVVFLFASLSIIASILIAFQLFSKQSFFNRFLDLYEQTKKLDRTVFSLRKILDRFVSLKMLDYLIAAQRKQNEMVTVLRLAIKEKDEETKNRLIARAMAYTMNSNHRIEEFKNQFVDSVVEIESER